MCNSNFIDDDFLENSLLGCMKGPLVRQQPSGGSKRSGKLNSYVTGSRQRPREKTNQSPAGEKLQNCATIQNTGLSRKQKNVIKLRVRMCQSVVNVNAQGLSVKSFNMLGVSMIYQVCIGMPADISFFTKSFYFYLSISYYYYFQLVLFTDLQS